MKIKQLTCALLLALGLMRVAAWSLRGIPPSMNSGRVDLYAVAPTKQPLTEIGYTLGKKWVSPSWKLGIPSRHGGYTQFFTL